MIEKNEIKLNFHQFDSPFQDFLEEKLLFTFLNNRKKDLEKSGIKNLYSILSTKYNTVDHAVSTTLKHKTVFEKIEEISNRSPIIPIKNNRCFKKSLFSKIKSSFSKSRMFNSTDNINQINPSSPDLILNNNSNVEEAFVDVSELLRFLNEKNNLNEIFERKEIENILEDLHKLGLIVYFKKKSLSDTIISNPQWFNHLFKSILDFGRKNVEIIFESIFDKIKETNNYKMKEKLSKVLIWLKGNSKMEEIKDIWENKEELKKSNLDKISFESLLIKLEKYIAKLIEQKEFSILEIEALKDLVSSSLISQKFVFIDENQLLIELIDNLLEKYRVKGNKIFKEKKEFLMNILSQFDFVIPTKRLKYRMEGKMIRNIRTFVVPLLFPSFKPSHLSSFSNPNKKISQELILKFDRDEWNNFEFENEWIVEYFLPFKPSAVWKLLFMRIRGSCVGVNEREREIIEEMYWLNGFSFYLNEKDFTKAKTHVELEFVEEDNKSGQVSMKITIKSSLYDLNLFFSSLHQTIQSFVKEWIVSELFNKINIKITKKKENKNIQNIQKYFKISENLQFSDSFDHYFSNHNFNNNTNYFLERKINNKMKYDKFKCFNCGFTISLLDLKENTCDKCIFLNLIFNFILVIFFNFLIFHFFLF